MLKAMVGAAVLAQISWSAMADVLEVPGQFPTIQAAIDAAEAGDDILIAAGTYRELLDGRNKSLTLIGAGAGQTVLSGDLDGDGAADGDILMVNTADADVLPFLTFTGITFRDADNAIVIGRAGDVTVSGCDFESCRQHAMLFTRYMSQNTSLVRNLMFTDCHFTGHRSSIWMGNSEGVQSMTITRSTFSGLIDVPITVFCEVFQAVDSTFRDNTGGGIAVTTTTGYLRGCLFEGNKGSNPSGIAPESNSASISSETFVVQDCIFQFNGQDNEYAGALGVAGTGYYQDGNLLGGAIVRNTDFVGNKGHFGSALVPVGVWRIEGCLFTGNCGRTTGPINIGRSLHRNVISNCRFIENGTVKDDGTYWPRGGGGVCVESGIVVVEDCLFRGNIAGVAGALIANGPSWINRCRFEANRVRSDGGTEAGAIRARSDLIVTNSSFIGNHAVGGIGGAISSWKIPQNSNCFYYENTSKSGSVLYLRNSPPPTDDNAYPLDMNASLIVPTLQPTEGHLVGGGKVLTIDQGNNLMTTDIDSIGFVRAPSDGGDGWGDDPATADVDEGANDDFGDLRLQPGSPAIDAGRNDRLPRDTSDFDRDGDRDELLIGETDLLGQPRFLDDFHSPNAGGFAGFAGPIDFGPVEYQSEPCLADVNHDGVLSAADFSAWVDAFATSAPGCDQDGDGYCQTPDFNAWVANFNAGCP